MATDALSFVLGLFAGLLEYPAEALSDHVEACIDVLRVVHPEAADSLAEVERGPHARDQARMQELYTATFDMQPVCYPYVGYHLFGESYKRGAFMAKLAEGYRASGFSAGQELPDHLAVVLRFLSLGSEARSGEFGRALLREGLLPAIGKMTDALKPDSSNPYAAVLSALALLLADVAEKELVDA